METLWTSGLVWKSVELAKHDTNMRYERDGRIVLLEVTTVHIKNHVTGRLGVIKLLNRITDTVDVTPGDHLQMSGNIPLTARAGQTQTEVVTAERNIVIFYTVLFIAVGRMQFLKGETKCILTQRAAVEQTDTTV